MKEKGTILWIPERKIQWFYLEKQGTTPQKVNCGWVSRLNKSILYSKYENILGRGMRTYKPQGMKTQNVFGKHGGHSRVETRNVHPN